MHKVAVCRDTEMQTSCGCDIIGNTSTCSAGTDFVSG